MPTIIGHHDISKGKDHWLNSPKREEIFSQLGITNIRTFVSPDDPTKVALFSWTFQTWKDLRRLCSQRQPPRPWSRMAFCPKPW